MQTIYKFAAASGQDAECYGPVSNDEGFYDRGRSGYEAKGYRRTN
jgi:hypothetical protein